ncbi:MAG: hypothetical protein KGL39_13570, partial [Patescibacteria group bacterium]|nr:hypothetical protein [Patescibacteria group bacterium]
VEKEWGTRGRKGSTDDAGNDDPKAKLHSLGRQAKMDADDAERLASRYSDSVFSGKEDSDLRAKTRAAYATAAASIGAVVTHMEKHNLRGVTAWQKSEAQMRDMADRLSRKSA